MADPLPPLGSQAPNYAQIMATPNNVAPDTLGDKVTQFGQGMGYGAGDAITASLDDTKKMVTHPVDYATKLATSLAKMGMHPLDAANQASDAVSGLVAKAASSPMAAGDVLGGLAAPLPRAGKLADALQMMHVVPHATLPGQTQLVVDTHNATRQKERPHDPYVQGWTYHPNDQRDLGPLPPQPPRT